MSLNLPPSSSELLSCTSSFSTRKFNPCYWIFSQSLLYHTCLSNGPFSCICSKYFTLFVVFSSLLSELPHRQFCCWHHSHGYLGCCINIYIVVALSMHRQLFSTALLSSHTTQKTKIERDKSQTHGCCLTISQQLMCSLMNLSCIPSMTPSIVLIFTSMQV